MNPPYEKDRFKPEDVDPTPILYVRVQCPIRWCRGRNCPVIHTNGRTRDHKCRKCGYPFQSIECDPIPPDVPVIGQ